MQLLVSLCEKIVLSFSFYCLVNSLYFTQVESEQKEGDILKGGYIDNSTSVKIVPHVSCYYLIILVHFLGFELSFW